MVLDAGHLITVAKVLAIPQLFLSPLCSSRKIKSHKNLKKEKIVYECLVKTSF